MIKVHRILSLSLAVGFRLDLNVVGKGYVEVDVLGAGAISRNQSCFIVDQGFWTL